MMKFSTPQKLFCWTTHGTFFFLTGKDKKIISRTASNGQFSYEVVPTARQSERVWYVCLWSDSVIFGYSTKPFNVKHKETV